jgi:hypothetical protein
MAGFALAVASDLDVVVEDEGVTVRTETDVVVAVVPADDPDLEVAFDVLVVELSSSSLLAVLVVRCAVVDLDVGVGATDEETTLLGRKQESLCMLHVEPGGHLYELRPLAPVQMTLGRGFCSQTFELVSGMLSSALE